MAGTFSRLIILQAALACLMPVAAWAKLSQCQALLLPSDGQQVELPSYVQGRIRIATDEDGSSSARLKLDLSKPGLNEDNAENTLLWLIRGTSNLDSLPREKEIMDDGEIRLAFPITLDNGRTFKVVFRYSQSNPATEDRIGVLDKIEILDDYSFDVDIKVDPPAKVVAGPDYGVTVEYAVPIEHLNEVEAPKPVKAKAKDKDKDPGEAATIKKLIRKIVYGPRGRIYGLEIEGSIVPFKSHLNSADLKSYKDFFQRFFENDRYLGGARRGPEDLDEVTTVRDLTRVTRRLVRDNKFQAARTRLYRVAATFAIVSVASGGLALSGQYYSTLTTKPKETMVSGLSHEKFGEIKLYGSSAPGTGNQFRVSAEDDVRLKNESTVVLKDKKGKDVTFSVTKTKKGYMVLQMLSNEPLTSIPAPERRAPDKD